jgi:hypothetical protein
MTQYQTGRGLLTDWGCKTREEKLARACKALMGAVNDLHIELKNQDLAKLLTDKNVYCSCADAYRMGYEALKRNNS